MLVIVGTGGTAGHIFPALATAERLRERGADVLFVGRKDGQEAALVPAAGFRMETVQALPFDRGFTLGAIRAPFAALRAAHLVRPVVRRADVVLGMGGYVSVPVSLAARRERVPLVLHEQNAIAGLANRAAARWARAVALSFEEARRQLPRRARTVVTGNPIRAEIAAVPERRAELAREARTALDLDERRRTVVVFGGSQGALRLNRATVGMCARLAERTDVQILLLTGPKHHDEIRRQLPATPLLRTVGFLARMDHAYAVADLAVARAGAATVAELTACEVPAILVPYPHATGRHQEANAHAVSRAGGAEVLADEQVDGDELHRRVSALLDDLERLGRMRAGARSFGRPDAADALADVVVGAARRAR